MKGDTEVLLFIAFYFAGALTFSYIHEEPMNTFLEVFFAPLATLAAAFFGARYAFLLQNNKLLSDRIEQEVSAGNIALFDLIRTLNRFTAIRKQFIDPHRELPERYVKILPVSSLQGFETEFDYKELAYLNHIEPNFLIRLSLLEQDVAATIETISQRSDAHFHTVQPTVEALERANPGAQITLQQIDQALGRRAESTIKMSTDFMIEGVDDVIGAAKSLIPELRKLLISKYPEEKFLQAELA